MLNVFGFVNFLMLSFFVFLGVYKVSFIFFKWWKGMVVELNIFILVLFKKLWFIKYCLFDFLVIFMCVLVKLCDVFCEVVKICCVLYCCCINNLKMVGVVGVMGVRLFGCIILEFVCFRYVIIVNLKYFLFCFIYYYG